jgi:3-methyladenine DNA glycosylase AlkC
MGFRPHLAADLDSGLKLLMRVTKSNDHRIRRFGIEVTRPRSVWGPHIGVLKANPEKGEALLENVSADPSRYVQLSVGNWLNDASKSKPEWVRAVTHRWLLTKNPHTVRIVERGLRTLGDKGDRQRPIEHARQSSGRRSQGRQP